MATETTQTEPPVAAKLGNEILYYLSGVFDLRPDGKHGQKPEGLRNVAVTAKGISGVTSYSREPVPPMDAAQLAHLNRVWADLTDRKRCWYYPPMVALMVDAAKRGDQDLMHRIDNALSGGFDSESVPYYAEMAWEAWQAGHRQLCREWLHMLCLQFTPRHEYWLELEKVVAKAGDEACLNSYLENYDFRQDSTWTVPLNMALAAGHQELVIRLLRKWVHLIKRSRVPRGTDKDCWDVFRHYYRDSPAVLAVINELAEADKAATPA